jgi:myosin-1
MGNLSFSELQGGEASECAEPAQLTPIAELLMIDAHALQSAFCTREITAVGQTTVIQLKPHEAELSRDTFAKALYDKLFDFVVDTINKSILATAKPEITIGVLDIYGFEIFEKNSFEQFCINFCNEKLQQLFIHLVLKQEQEEYEREGIEWTAIDYFDNEPILTLIEGSPIGMFKLLDEACSVGRTTPEQCLDKFKSNFEGHAHITFNGTDAESRTIARDAFRIRHYAGVVDYRCVLVAVNNCRRSCLLCVRSLCVLFVRVVLCICMMHSASATTPLSLITGACCRQ